jgi:hypothetical protein
MCEPTTCTAQADCTSAQVCSGGNCLSGLNHTCATTGGCADPFTCTNGVCSYLTNCTMPSDCINPSTDMCQALPGPPDCVVATGSPCEVQNQCGSVTQATCANQTCLLIAGQPCPGGDSTCSSDMCLGTGVCGCATDADCPANNICNQTNNTCNGYLGGACSPTETCLTPFYCDIEVTPNTCQYVPCTSGCPANTSCSVGGGGCILNPQQPCVTQTQCGDNTDVERCDSTYGECLYPGGVACGGVGDEGNCISKTCAVFTSENCGCNTDSDCISGQTCSGTNGYCQT